MPENTKPFDLAFVINLTKEHCRRSVDLSIRKTFSRLEDFNEDEAKNLEVFKTLALLHGMRKMIDDFQIPDSIIEKET